MSTVRMKSRHIHNFNKLETVKVANEIEISVTEAQKMQDCRGPASGFQFGRRRGRPLSWGWLAFRALAPDGGPLGGARRRASIRAGPLPTRMLGPVWSSDIGRASEPHGEVRV